MWSIHFHLVFQVAILVGLLHLVVLGVRWILRPYLDWKNDEQTLLSQCIKWSSDQINPEILLSYIFKSPSSFSLTHTETNLIYTIYISIVIPAYNEEKRLLMSFPAMIKYLNTRALASSRFFYEIILVDDGSTDNTTDVATKMSTIYPPVKGCIRVIQLKQNKGKGLATRIGVQASRGEYILMADADGATRFSDIEQLEKRLCLEEEKLIQKKTQQMSNDNSILQDNEFLTLQSSLLLPHTLEHSLYQIAIGSRQHLMKTGAVTKRTWLRNLLMHGFHLLVSTVIGNTIQDTQCGFKLFSRTAAKHLFLNLHIHRWAFDVEIIVLSYKLGYKIHEISVNWEEIPGSKLQPLLAALQMTRDIITIKLLYYLEVWTPKCLPNCINVSSYNDKSQ